MPRVLHRFYGTGDLHFVTFSCYQRQPLRIARLGVIYSSTFWSECGAAIA